MPAADLEAVVTQQIAHHAAARERVVQVQFVDPAHERRISWRGRPRQVVHRDARELQQPAGA